jgi:hypothetical protein
MMRSVPTEGRQIEPPAAQQGAAAAEPQRVPIGPWYRFRLIPGRSKRGTEALWLSQLNRDPLGRSNMVRVAAYIVIVTWMFGCAAPETVSSRLRHALDHSQPSELIRLSDLTDFQWKVFVALGPYTTREGAESALGFAWPDFDRFQLNMSDTFSLLVFTNGGSVVRVEKHPRCKPDFDPDTLGRPLSPEAAVFTIEPKRDCPMVRAAA